MFLSFYGNYCDKFEGTTTKNINTVLMKHYLFNKKQFITALRLFNEICSQFVREEIHAAHS